MRARVVAQLFYKVFDHISKHLKGSQKYSPARRILNSLPGVWNVVKHGLEGLIYSIQPGPCYSVVRSSSFLFYISASFHRI